MKPIVHWLMFEQRVSGLYNYTYSLHKATLANGYESHICYIDPDLKHGGKLRMPSPVVGEVEFSDWKVSEGAINITHDTLPHAKLDNWVTELHGTPDYMAQSMDTLTVTTYKLGRVKMALTRFPSHIQYWKEYTNTPIYAIPPGVNLDFWTPKGVSQRFARPLVLWADTVREGVKNPTNLLYAMKIVNRELPTWGLKLVAIPPNEIAGYAYLCGRLGLDSIIEFPLEPMIGDMAVLYRGVRDVGGVMYSDTNEEGSNSSWEAEAVGLPVVHHKNNPQEIAEAIIETAKKAERKPIQRDIRKTADAMCAYLEMTFG